jgi:MftR C-terminal domain
VAAAPQGVSPMEIVADVLRSVAALFPNDRRPYSRTRQSVIDQNPALQEREVHKLASLATSLAEALRARGVDELAAALAAESCVTVFRISFTQWIRDGEQRSLADISANVLRELLLLTGKAESHTIP